MIMGYVTDIPLTTRHNLRPLFIRKIGGKDTLSFKKHPIFVKFYL